MREMATEQCCSSYKSYSVHLRHNSDTVSEENQSHRHTEEKARRDGDLQKPIKAFSSVFIKLDIYLHWAFLQLRGEIKAEQGSPKDFQEVDILMNRCILCDETMQSKKTHD
ncbi:hypothetical protein AMECASPLE_028081 [Ameca splendens]|uniref:Uncharacterized protein n=1 Tax=Ameca splendens TaxID=208324 RepID=A0ABV0Y5T7_9TELE